MPRFKAHPTVYRGIQMRSRLEAKYAAWFDELGWKWVYEPYDLPGYSPDYSLDLPQSPGVLVEVKPATKLAHLTKAARTIIRAGWKDRWLVLGVHPTMNLHGKGGVIIGQLDFGQGRGEAAWANASNATQWKPPPPPKCAKCGKQEHLLHYLVCK